MITATSLDATDAYKETLMLMAYAGKVEDSRNGKVLTMQEPYGLTILRPCDRVIFDPARNANPFFHMPEFVWMMTGSDRVNWISQFNSRMNEYANDGVINGAYGHRWLTDNGDQVEMAMCKLKKDLGTRQAVISMWNPQWDNKTGQNDYPCNTHIYLRVVDGGLNMTVCNRSNDIVWGMLGANVVHMTMLQELIALNLNLKVGKYHVLTNNAHIYEHHWPLMEGRFAVEPGIYGAGVPLLHMGDDYTRFRKACDVFIRSGAGNTGVYWLDYVAAPAYLAWMERGNGTLGLAHAKKIRDINWRRACTEWLQRRLERIAERGKLDDTTQR